MKTLELRRHSHRKHGGGSQLSQEGVDLARRVGAKMGPFAVVATSVAARTRETAIAMGFAVDHEIVMLTTDEAVYAEMEAAQWWKEPAPFAALAKLIAKKGATWRFGASLAGAYRDLLTPLKDGDRALVISHTGDLELAMVSALPDADHASWGRAAFAPCEGARLTFEGELERFTRIEFLRGEEA
jgi:broad specificity phosphatase PhoE